jgi:hypothetical protein
LIPVKFHIEAEAELSGAALFYEECVVGLAILFAAETRKSIEFSIKPL